MKNSVKSAFVIRLSIIVVCILGLGFAELFNAFATKNFMHKDTILALVFFVASLVSCLSLFIYVKNQIGEPILYITERAKELSKGKLDGDFSVNSDNEIGILGNALNDSVKEISLYVEDIDRAMMEFSKGNLNIKPSQPFIGDFKNIENSITEFIITMSHTIKTILQASDQVSIGSEQVSDSSQILAQGATEQAGSIETLSSSLTELSDQIRKTADNFQEIDGVINVTAEEVLKGDAKMKDMMEAMEDIIEFSQKINQIIKTIDDLAFQTNILALNAAVEAARAGSAGKGFSVVADEVRNLAQKSAMAAKDITELIENSIGAVNGGASLAKETSEVFGNIVKMSAEITDKVNITAETTEQQSEVIKQLAKGVSQITSVVQTNSATSEESAAASEELNTQAHLMKELVANFKLKN